MMVTYMQNTYNLCTRHAQLNTLVEINEMNRALGHLCAHLG